LNSCHHCAVLHALEQTTDDVRNAGVTWGGKDGYEKEARRLETTRYKAGMPRVNDGALLFLQTMLAKMVPPEEGGSRVAIIFNGSPLSNGDCGSGETEIRRGECRHPQRR
jgi:type I restriction enzyme M protein